MTTKLHYEVKVRYERIDETGKAKKVTEGYIVSALESQDVERAILSGLSSYRDVEVLSIKQLKVEQIIAVCDRERHREKWYRARCAATELDDNGRARKRSLSFVINADDFEDAASCVRKWRAMMASDIELLSLSISTIKDWLI